MKAILDSAARWLTEKTGLPVLYDPQPLRSAEPHLRLTFMGSEKFGENTFAAKFQISILGAGDGPGTYLSSMIKASAKLSRLYDGCADDRNTEFVCNGQKIRMTLCSGLVATGSFTANAEKEVETNQWSYVFSEPRQMELYIPMEAIE